MQEFARHIRAVAVLAIHFVIHLSHFFTGDFPG